MLSFCQVGTDHGIFKEIYGSFFAIHKKCPTRFIWNGQNQFSGSSNHDMTVYMCLIIRIYSHGLGIQTVYEISKDTFIYIVSDQIQIFSIFGGQSKQRTCFVVSKIQNIFLLYCLKCLIIRTITQFNIIYFGVACVCIQMTGSFYIDRSASSILINQYRDKYVTLCSQSIYQIILAFYGVKMINIADFVIFMQVFLYIIGTAEQFFQRIILT